MDVDVVACTACDARQRELVGLRAELDQARARVTELKADKERLTGEFDRLQQRLEGARRAGKRQAAPFSRDAKKADPKRPGRKSGEDDGPRARQPVPADDEIDEIIGMGLPDRCECGGQVAHDRTMHQYQEASFRRGGWCDASMWRLVTARRVTVGCVAATGCRPRMRWVRPG